MRQDRIAWIDCARGAAIILIVMHHARDYALVRLPPVGELLRWAYIDPFLIHIRLPLFFTLSGMLAWGLQSHRKNGFNFRRPISLAMVYLAWSVIMLAVIPTWPNDHWTPVSLQDFLGILIGESVLWYLWALPLAFFFAFITRALPPAAALMLACILGYLLVQYGPGFGGSFRALGHYLPFYILGARYAEAIVAIAQWRNLRGSALLVAIYLLLLDPRFNSFGVDILRGTLGAAAGLVIAMWATEKWPKGSAKMGWLGQNTLPIYVLHFPIIAFLGSAAVRHWSLGPRSLDNLLFSPTLTAATIALSLALFAGIERAGLGWTLLKPRGGNQRARSSTNTGLQEG
jgi:fucose 4-O-acetylase-like acetyltransferase